MKINFLARTSVSIVSFLIIFFFSILHAALVKIKLWNFYCFSHSFLFISVDFFDILLLFSLIKRKFFIARNVLFCLLCYKFFDSESKSFRSYEIFSYFTAVNDHNGCLKWEKKSVLGIFSLLFGILCGALFEDKFLELIWLNEWKWLGLWESYSLCSALFKG